MYRCLKKNAFNDSDGYQLVVIRNEDIENIRQWRNAQIRVLRQQKMISPEEQQNYFQNTIWPSLIQEHPKQILFSILFQQVCIGYGGLTNIDWESLRAEVSFLVDPLRPENSTIFISDFYHFLNLLCQVAFEDLHLHRLFTETYAFRSIPIKILENFGFQQEGILREHIFKDSQWHDSFMHGLLSKDWVRSVPALQTAFPKLVDVEKSEHDNGHQIVEHPAVLISSISKKMPLIEAVRHATNKLGKFQTIHGYDSDAFCLGQYGVDQFWHSSLLNEMEPEQIIAYCQQNRITAIIPTRDADLEFYAYHSSLFHKWGIQPMVSPLETIFTCSDKKKFAEVLLKDRFPVIPTFLSPDNLEASSYVVKERKGAGSQLLGLDLTREEALRQSCHLKEPIFQPYIKGQEWSVDVYRSFKGDVKRSVARQRNTVVNGESQVTTTVHYPKLEHLCQEMAEKLNIRGPAVFQVIENGNGNFHVIECNPRFGGASTASIAVGWDVFFWFFVECLSLSIHDYPFLRHKGEIRQIRYLTDRLLPWSSYLI
jgi:RimJ/RimL family protein N-acetyltransferase